MEPIIFMFCITLHNIEEAVWMHDWRTKHKPFGRKVPAKERFVFAVLGITILAYLTAGLHLLYPDNLWLDYAFIGFVGAMLINALMPHLLLSIIYKSCCPGVFTGCFLIMPFHIIFLPAAINDHMKIAELLAATAIVGLILLVAIPIFELVAKQIFRSGGNLQGN